MRKPSYSLPKQNPLAFISQSVFRSQCTGNQSADCTGVITYAGAEDTPWASKTSVYALLNSDLPGKKPVQPDEEEEEDPMALMIKQKKPKKVCSWTCEAVTPPKAFLSHDFRYVSSILIKMSYAVSGD